MPPRLLPFGKFKDASHRRFGAFVNLLNAGLWRLMGDDLDSLIILQLAAQEPLYGRMFIRREENLRPPRSHISKERSAGKHQMKTNHTLDIDLRRGRADVLGDKPHEENRKQCRLIDVATQCRNFS
jgi:hypothetical protein